MPFAFTLAIALVLAIYRYDYTMEGLREVEEVAQAVDQASHAVRREQNKQSEN